MTLPARSQTATIADLEALGDLEGKHELQAGLLLSEPLPGFRHGRVAAAIAERLRAYVRPRALGVVLGNDTGFILFRNPDTVRGPDVAFVSRARFDEVGDPEGAFPGAPDLAVEVLSPSAMPEKVHGKVADYLAAGTRMVWVVDPTAKTVTTYRDLLSPRVLRVADELDGGDVIEGFRVVSGELFEV